MKKKSIKFTWFLMLLYIMIAPVIGQTTAAMTDSTAKEDESEEKVTEPEVKSELEQRRETLLYGLDSEVDNLIKTLMNDEDDSFSEEILDVFETARNTVLRERIINYFIQFEDLALKDYALDLLVDPYEEKNSTVNTTMKYVEALKITEAAPLLRDLIEGENEAYFSAAISAIGAVGGPDEAQFLTEFFDTDLSLPEKQALVRALGKLQAIETYDKLVEMAEDEDENAFVRMYATEAIGNMKPEESFDILIELYASTDPNLRQYVIKGVAPNTSEEAQKLLLTALKDDHYKVRLEAISAVQSQKIIAAGPALLYRAQNDSETAVKRACYETFAILNYDEGIDYLISLLETTKVNDTVKAGIASVLLKYDITNGIDAVIAIATETLTDDKKKNLRYALGKEFAKYENQQFESICAAYLASDDISTKGTGLDIYQKNPYLSLLSTVQILADGDPSVAIKAKAKSILEEKLEATEDVDLTSIATQ